MRPFKPYFLILSLSLLALMLSAPAVKAQSNGTIQACYDSQNGQLRIALPGQCKPSEIPISWYVSVAPGSINTNQIADGAVTAAKIGAGQVVKSLNGLKDDVLLAAGSNITITPAGNTLTIAAAGAGAIAHDSTLKGDGSAGAPLGVNVPLILTHDTETVISATGGAVGVQGTGETVGLYGRRRSVGSQLPYVNTGGAGVLGDSDADGVVGIGKGTGVRGSSHGAGQPGVSGDGGGGDAENHAGIGVTGFGGGNPLQNAGGADTSGGTGVQGTGGTHDTRGGDGVVGIGADAIVPGTTGGNGIVGKAGLGRSVGTNIGTDGLAGFFDGKVQVIGELAVSRFGLFSGSVKVVEDLNVVGTKNFMIDHPLDPENKYLLHAAIESSEVINLYTGKVTLDTEGTAIVRFPEWFEALNRDFRYSLTPIGAPAPNLYIAKEIAGNCFKIAGGAPGMKVSWQVAGVRSDAGMRSRPFQVEQDKPARERGTYLNPEAFGRANADKQTGSAKTGAKQ